MTTPDRQTSGSTLRASDTASARRPLWVGLLVFLLALAASALLVSYLEQQHEGEQKAQVARQAGNHARAIQTTIERALSATYALAALVRQSNGSVPYFEETATHMLPLYPGAASLQLAPGGIVQRVVPLAGNEKAIGHNLLQDPLRNKEAFLARDTGRLTLAGPFNLIQGGLGAVGRLPVFLDDVHGKPVFWGFVTVLVRFPAVLNNAQLNVLTETGLAYELWRTHPDSGERQIIAAAEQKLVDPVDYEMEMPNGKWVLSVAPVRGWGSTARLVQESLLALLFSLLLGYMAKLLSEARAYKKNLEIQVAQRTAELSESEQRLRNMSDAAGAYLWEVDANIVYTHVTPMSERVKGYRPVELVGHSPMEFMPKEEVATVREIVGRAIAEKTSFRLQHSNVTPDGRRLWEEVHGTPYFDGEGRLAGVRGAGLDINTRKAAEESLRQSEQHFRGIFENSPDIILLISLDGFIRDANPEACRAYGYQHDEFIGKHGSQFVHPDHTWKFAGALAAIRAGENYEVESVDVRKDGTPFPIEVHISPFNHLGEEVMLCSIRDISERRRMEEQLQDQQQHLENLVQQRTAELSEALERIRKITGQVPGLVYQLRMRPDGSFSMPYASSAIAGIFRLAPDEVHEDASRVFERIHPADMLGLVASIHASARSLSQWHYEFRTRFDDGTERWLLGDALPQREPDDTVLWHGFITDITERKQAAAALQRSERHYAAIAQSATDAIITTDSSEVVVGWNRSAELMFGYAESEIIGQSVSSLMPERFRQRHRDGLARVAAGGVPRMIGKTTELVGKRKDGSEFPIEISLAQYQSDDGWHCSAIIRDISERKRAERRLSELSAHLQTVREEEKASIAREIHDDLGGTLTALKMNTYWLDEEIASLKDGDVLRDYVKSISKQLDDVVLVTRRIITDLRPTILDELGLLAALEWHAEGFYKRTGIVCRVNCAEDAGNIDQMRSIALFRIFQEALTNVARHSGASKVEVEYQNNGREAVLTVTDNGRGLPDEHAVSRNSYGIRGMRERVEQLGGEIKFACPLEGGLSLTVSLPLLKDSSQEAQA